MKIFFKNLGFFFLTNLGWLIIVCTIIYAYVYYFSGAHEFNLKNLINLFAFLGFAITYENVINKYLFQKKINDKVDIIQKHIEKDIIPGLGGIGVKHYNDHNLYKYLISRLSINPKSWNILQFGYWNESDKSREGLPEYHTKIKNAVMAGELKVKRVVTIWSMKHFEHIYERMIEFENKDYYFNCIVAREPFPSNTNMIIINNEEIVIWPFVNKFDRGEDILGYISIKHQDIVNYFQAYFELIFDNNNSIKAYNIRNEFVNEFKNQLLKVHPNT